MSTLHSHSQNVHSENSAAALVSTPDDPGGWIACAGDLGHLPRGSEYEAWLAALDLGHYPDECPETPLHDDFEPSELDRAEAAAILNADDDTPFDDGRLFPLDADDLDWLMSQRAACESLPETLEELNRQIADIRLALETKGGVAR